MFGLLPPDDPFLLNFGFLQIRWYGVWIVGGALLAAAIAARRAEQRGFDRDDIWNQLMLGLVLSIACAHAYYVAFEWQRYAGQSWWAIFNPRIRGLAIHGGLIGAFLAAIIYTRWRRLPLWQWADITLPTVLVGQALGRLGNFFNQEAYGRPIEGGVPPVGLLIEAQYRIDPYRDLQRYPYATTFFHATFFYEAVWNLLGFALILWLERQLRQWRRVGDLAACYAIWYGAGRLWIEGLRTDSLCTNGIGGSCEGALRTAQIASIVLIVIGVAGVLLNHMRAGRPAVEIEAAYIEMHQQEQRVASKPRLL